MDSEGDRHDDQKTQPPEQTDRSGSATLDANTIQPNEGVVEQQTSSTTVAGAPTLVNHPSVDSGIDTDNQTGPSGNEQEQSQPPVLVEPQLAEEQELIPDVRRVPKRHRRRRRFSNFASHKYVFRRRSIATQLLEATRA